MSQASNSRISGMNKAVWGNFNTVSGMNALVVGDGNRVSGMNATVYGNDNTVSGMNANVYGLRNRVSGLGCQSFPPSRRVPSLQEYQAKHREPEGEEKQGNYHFAQGATVINGPQIPPGSSISFGDGLMTIFSPTGAMSPKGPAAVQKQPKPFSLLTLEGHPEAAPDECDDDSRLCIVCLTNLKNVILQPCNHVVFCVECARAAEDSPHQCPTCRKEFTSASVVYW